MASKLYNLARATTATTGTGTITLGGAVTGYLTFALAGVSDGDVVDYAIFDTTDSEIGTGTYTASGTTLTRSVTKSTNANAAINLSGSAQVFITPRAETMADAGFLTTGSIPSARLPTTQTYAGAAPQLTLGVNATTIGSVKMFGNTSGDVTLQPTAAAGTATVLTLPASTDTLIGKATTDTLTNKTLTSPTLVTPALGTPASGTLTNCTGLPASGLVASTSQAVGFGSIELGAASDTTISRSAAGVIAVEGVPLYSNIPQNSQSTAYYTTVLADAQKHIFHPSADTSARTWTIDSNANVAYPIGTAITFINQNSGGVITIAITTDTMRLAGAGTTGSRTLAANGIATAIKVTSTEWIISGTGLT